MKHNHFRIFFLLMAFAALLSCRKESPFPETEEEIMESTSLTHAIDSVAIPLITQAFEEAEGGNIDVKSLAKRLKKIDGVAAATVESEDVILLKQKDGVYINVLLTSFSGNSLYEGLSNSGSVYQTRSAKMVNDKISIVCGEERPGKALILAHNYSENLDLFGSFYSESREYGKSLYDAWYNQLKDCGFQVDSSLDRHVTIDKFFGENLEKYDVIVINSHGACDLTLIDGSGKSTVVLTSSPVSSFYATVFPNLALCMVREGTYYCLTSDFLLEENPSLNNTGVMIDACESYHDDDLADAFYTCGASFYCGFTNNVKKRDGLIIIKDLIEKVGKGNDITKSFELVKDHSVYLDGTSVGGLDILRVENNPNYSDLPCYLFNPSPFNLSTSLYTSLPLAYELSWEMNPSLANHRYEVFVGEKSVFTGKLDDENNRYSYIYEPEESGHYEWHVETTAYDDNWNEIDTFSSGTEPLEVADLISLYPERIDFGAVGSADSERRQKEFNLVNMGSKDVFVYIDECPEGFKTNIGEGVTVKAKSTFHGVVTFSFWEEKTYTGTIEFKSDAGTTLSMEVMGAGFYNGATVGYSVDELEFNDVFRDTEKVPGLISRRFCRHDT